MPDPYRYVRPGDALSIGAQAWNAMLDVVRPHGRLSTLAGLGGSGRESIVVPIKNETGADLVRCSIVGLNGPLFTPDDDINAFLRQPAFRGALPDETAHRRRYGVLLDPAADGQFGRAFLAGVCQARVDVIDESHQFANVVDGETGFLRSSRFGHAQILWTEADGAYYGYDTGEMWALVRLGVTTSCFSVGIALEDIDPRDGYSGYGVGEVELYRSEAGAPVSANETITAYNASSDETYGVSIAAGTWVSVAWDSDGTPFVAPLEC